MVKRSFDNDAEVVHTREYSSVDKPTSWAAILSSDYNTADNPDSDNYSVFSRLSSPDDLLVDAAMQPILWENANLSCFGGGCKGKRCHLMSQTSYIQHADNENNILIMSAENHDRFDSFSPNIAIRWDKVTDRIVTVNEQEVTFCDIVIECCNRDVYKCVQASIKAGTTSEPQNLSFLTSVAVPNPTEFKQFLTFKYLETKGLQNIHRYGSENALAKMSRVRADVKVTMEEDPRITIDLSMKVKNKRNLASMRVAENSERL